MRVLNGILVTLFVIGLACPVAAQKQVLAEDEIRAAVQYGSTKHDRWGAFIRLKIGVGLPQFARNEDWIDAYVFTPTEWIKWQAYVTAQNLKPLFAPGKEDLLPVLHVLVASGTGDMRYTCSQVSNIVLRDTKRTTVIQPGTF
jgi:hypothetical protein